MRVDRTRRNVLRALASGVLGAVTFPILAACGRVSQAAERQRAATPTVGPVVDVDLMLTPSVIKPNGVAYRIVMQDTNRFVPASISIPRGVTLEWLNGSAAPHSVTGDPSRAANPANALLPPGVRPWDSGMIPSGQTYEYAFDTAGTYTYCCVEHEGAGMVGRIIVAPDYQPGP